MPVISDWILDMSIFLRWSKSPDNFIHSGQSSSHTTSIRKDFQRNLQESQACSQDFERGGASDRPLLNAPSAWVGEPHKTAPLQSHNTSDGIELLRPFEICLEMHANEIDALYDRHQKVSPSPNPHHKASNSAKHEDIWKLQFIVCNMKYPRSQLRAFLDTSGSFIGSGAGF